MTSTLVDTLRSVYLSECTSQGVPPCLGFVRWITSLPQLLAVHECDPHIPFSLTTIATPTPTTANKGNNRTVVAVDNSVITRQIHVYFRQRDHEIPASSFATTASGSPDPQRQGDKIGCMFAVLRIIPFMWSTFDFAGWGLGPHGVGALIQHIRQLWASNEESKCLSDDVASNVHLQQQPAADDRHSSHRALFVEVCKVAAARGQKISMAVQNAMSASIPTNITSINLTGNKMTLRQFQVLCELVQSIPTVMSVLVDDSDFYPAEVVSELCAANVSATQRSSDRGESLANPAIAGIVDVAIPNTDVEITAPHTTSTSPPPPPNQMSNATADHGGRSDVSTAERALINAVKKQVSAHTLSQCPMNVKRLLSHVKRTVLVSFAPSAPIPSSFYVFLFEYLGDLAVEEAAQLYIALLQRRRERTGPKHTTATKKSDLYSPRGKFKFHSSGTAIDHFMASGIDGVTTSPKHDSPGGSGAKSPPAASVLGTPSTDSIPALLTVFRRASKLPAFEDMPVTPAISPAEAREAWRNTIREERDKSEERLLRAVDPKVLMAAFRAWDGQTDAQSSRLHPNSAGTAVLLHHTGQVEVTHCAICGGAIPETALLKRSEPTGTSNTITDKSDTHHLNTVLERRDRIRGIIGLLTIKASGSHSYLVSSDALWLKRLSVSALDLCVEAASDVPSSTNATGAMSSIVSGGEVDAVVKRSTSPLLQPPSVDVWKCVHHLVENLLCGAYGQEYGCLPLLPQAVTASTPTTTPSSSSSVNATPDPSLSTPLLPTVSDLLRIMMPGKFSGSHKRKQYFSPESSSIPDSSVFPLSMPWARPPELAPPPSDGNGIAIRRVQKSDLKNRNAVAWAIAAVLGDRLGVAVDVGILEKCILASHNSSHGGRSTTGGGVDLLTACQRAVLAKEDNPSVVPKGVDITGVTHINFEGDEARLAAAEEREKKISARSSSSPSVSFTHHNNTHSLPRSRSGAGSWTVRGPNHSHTHTKATTDDTNAEIELYQYSPRSITSRDDTASSAVTTSTPLLRASPTNYHTTESPTEIIPHGTTYTTATTNNQNHNATADTTTVTHQPPPYQRIHIPPVFSFTPAGNDPSVSSTFQTMVAYFATLGQCHHSHSSSSSFPSNTSEDNHTASPTHKCYGVPRWNGSKGILGIHLPPAFFATHNLRLAEGSALSRDHYLKSQKEKQEIRKLVQRRRRLQHLRKAQEARKRPHPSSHNPTVLPPVALSSISASGNSSPAIQQLVTMLNTSSGGNTLHASVSGNPLWASHNGMSVSMIPQVNTFLEHLNKDGSMTMEASVSRNVASAMQQWISQQEMAIAENRHQQQQHIKKNSKNSSSSSTSSADGSVDDDDISKFKFGDVKDEDGDEVVIENYQDAVDSENKKKKKSHADKYLSPYYWLSLVRADGRLVGNVEDEDKKEGVEDGDRDTHNNNKSTTSPADNLDRLRERSLATVVVVEGVCRSPETSEIVLRCVHGSGRVIYLGEAVVNYMADLYGAVCFADMQPNEYSALCESYTTHFCEQQKAVSRAQTNTSTVIVPPVKLLQPVGHMLPVEIRDMLSPSRIPAVEALLRYLALECRSLWTPPSPPTRSSKKKSATGNNDDITRPVSVSSRGGGTKRSVTFASSDSPKNQHPNFTPSVMSGLGQRSCELLAAAAGTALKADTAGDTMHHPHILSYITDSEAEHLDNILRADRVFTHHTRKIYEEEASRLSTVAVSKAYQDALDADALPELLSTPQRKAIQSALVRYFRQELSTHANSGVHQQADNDYNFTGASLGMSVGGDQQHRFAASPETRRALSEALAAESLVGTNITQGPLYSKITLEENTVNDVFAVLAAIEVVTRQRGGSMSTDVSTLLRHLKGSTPSSTTDGDNIATNTTNAHHRRSIEKIVRKYSLGEDCGTSVGQDVFTVGMSRSASSHSLKEIEQSIAIREAVHERLRSRKFGGSAAIDTAAQVSRLDSITSKAVVVAVSLTVSLEDIEEMLSLIRGGDVVSQLEWWVQRPLSFRRAFNTASRRLIGSLPADGTTRGPAALPLCLLRPSDPQTKSPVPSTTDSAATYSHTNTTTAGAPFPAANSLLRRFYPLCDTTAVSTNGSFSGWAGLDPLCLLLDEHDDKETLQWIRNTCETSLVAQQDRLRSSTATTTSVKQDTTTTPTLSTNKLRLGNLKRLPPYLRALRTRPILSHVHTAPPTTTRSNSAATADVAAPPRKVPSPFIVVDAGFPVAMRRLEADVLLPAVSHTQSTTSSKQLDDDLDDHHEDPMNLLDQGMFAAGGRDLEDYSAADARRRISLSANAQPPNSTSSHIVGGRKILDALERSYSINPADESLGKYILGMGLSSGQKKVTGGVVDGDAAASVIGGGGGTSTNAAAHIQQQQHQQHKPPQITPLITPVFVVSYSDDGVHYTPVVGVAVCVSLYKTAEKEASEAAAADSESRRKQASQPVRQGKSFQHHMSEPTAGTSAIAAFNKITIESASREGSADHHHPTGNVNPKNGADHHHQEHSDMDTSVCSDSRVLGEELADDCGFAVFTATLNFDHVGAHRYWRIEDTRVEEQARRLQAIAASYPPPESKDDGALDGVDDGSSSDSGQDFLQVKRSKSKSALTATSTSPDGGTVIKLGASLRRAKAAAAAQANNNNHSSLSTAAPDAATTSSQKSGAHSVVNPLYSSSLAEHHHLATTPVLMSAMRWYEDGETFSMVNTGAPLDHQKEFLLAMEMGNLEDEEPTDPPTSSSHPSSNTSGNNSASDKWTRLRPYFASASGSTLVVQQSAVGHRGSTSFSQFCFPLGSPCLKESQALQTLFCFSSRLSSGGRRGLVFDGSTLDDEELSLLGCDTTASSESGGGGGIPASRRAITPDLFDCRYGYLGGLSTLRVPVPPHSAVTTHNPTAPVYLFCMDPMTGSSSTEASKGTTNVSNTTLGKQIVVTVNKSTGAVVEGPIPVHEHIMFQRLPQPMRSHLDGAWPLSETMMLLFSGYFYTLYDVAAGGPIVAPQPWFRNIPGRQSYEKNEKGRLSRVLLREDDVGARTSAKSALFAGSKKKVNPLEVEQELEVLSTSHFPFRIVDCVFSPSGLPFERDNELIFMSGTECIRWCLPSVDVLVKQLSQRYMDISILKAMPPRGASSTTPTSNSTTKHSDPVVPHIDAEFKTMGFAKALDYHNRRHKVFASVLSPTDNHSTHSQLFPNAKFSFNELRIPVAHTNKLVRSFPSLYNTNVIAEVVGRLLSNSSSSTTCAAAPIAIQEICVKYRLTSTSVAISSMMNRAFTDASVFWSLTKKEIKLLQTTSGFYDGGLSTICFGRSPFAPSTAAERYYNHLRRQQLLQDRSAAALDATRGGELFSGDVPHSALVRRKPSTVHLTIEPPQSATNRRHVSVRRPDEESRTSRTVSRQGSTVGTSDADTTQSSSSSPEGLPSSPFTSSVLTTECELLIRLVRREPIESFVLVGPPSGVHWTLQAMPQHNLHPTVISKAARTDNQFLMAASVSRRRGDSRTGSIPGADQMDDGYKSNFTNMIDDDSQSGTDDEQSVSTESSDSSGDEAGVSSVQLGASTSTSQNKASSSGAARKKKAAKSTLASSLSGTWVTVSHATQSSICTVIPVPSGTVPSCVWRLVADGASTDSASISRLFCFKEEVPPTNASTTSATNVVSPLSVVSSPVVLAKAPKHLVPISFGTETTLERISGGGGPSTAISPDDPTSPISSPAAVGFFVTEDLEEQAAMSLFKAEAMNLFFKECRVNGARTTFTFPDLHTVTELSATRQRGNMEASILGRPQQVDKNLIGATGAVTCSLLNSVTLQEVRVTLHSSALADQVGSSQFHPIQLVASMDFGTTFFPLTGAICMGGTAGVEPTQPEQTMGLYRVDMSLSAHSFGIVFDVPVTGITTVRLLSPSISTSQSIIREACLVIEPRRLFSIVPSNSDSVPVNCVGTIDDFPEPFGRNRGHGGNTATASFLINFATSTKGGFCAAGLAALSSSVRVRSKVFDDPVQGRDNVFNGTDEESNNSSTMGDKSPPINASRRFTLPLSVTTAAGMSSPTSNTTVPGSLSASQSENSPNNSTTGAVNAGVFRQIVPNTMSRINSELPPPSASIPTPGMSALESQSQHHNEHDENHRMPQMLSEDLPPPFVQNNSAECSNSEDIVVAQLRTKPWVGLPDQLEITAYIEHENSIDGTWMVVATATTILDVGAIERMIASQLSPALLSTPFPDDGESIEYPIHFDGIEVPVCFKRDLISRIPVGPKHLRIRLVCDVPPTMVGAEDAVASLHDLMSKLTVGDTLCSVRSAPTLASFTDNLHLGADNDNVTRPPTLTRTQIPLGLTTTTTPSSNDNPAYRAVVSMSLMEEWRSAAFAGANLYVTYTDNRSTNYYVSDEEEDAVQVLECRLLGFVRSKYTTHNMPHNRFRNLNEVDLVTNDLSGMVSVGVLGSQKVAVSSLRPRSTPVYIPLSKMGASCISGGLDLVMIEVIHNSEPNTDSCTTDDSDDKAAMKLDAIEFLQDNSLVRPRLDESLIGHSTFYTQQEMSALLISRIEYGGKSVSVPASGGIIPFPLRVGTALYFEGKSSSMERLYMAGAFIQVFGVGDTSSSDITDVPLDNRRRKDKERILFSLQASPDRIRYDTVAFIDTSKGEPVSWVAAGLPDGNAPLCWRMVCTSHPYEKLADATHEYLKSAATATATIGGAYGDINPNMVSFDAGMMGRSGGGNFMGNLTHRSSLACTPSQINLVVPDYDDSNGSHSVNTYSALNPLSGNKKKSEPVPVVVALAVSFAPQPLVPHMVPYRFTRSTTKFTSNTLPTSISSAEVKQGLLLKIHNIDVDVTRIVDSLVEAKKNDVADVGLHTHVGAAKDAPTITGLEFVQRDTVTAQQVASGGGGGGQQQHHQSSTSQGAGSPSKGPTSTGQLDKQETKSQAAAAATNLFVGVNILNDPVPFVRVSLYTPLNANHELLVQYSDDGISYNTVAVHVQRQGWCNTTWPYCGAHSNWRLSVSTLKSSGQGKKSRKSNASSTSFLADVDEAALGSLIVSVVPSAVQGIRWFQPVPPPLRQPLPNHFNTTTTSPSSSHHSSTVIATQILDCIALHECHAINTSLIPLADTTSFAASPIGLGIRRRHATLHNITNNANQLLRVLGQISEVREIKSRQPSVVTTYTMASMNAEASQNSASPPIHSDSGVFTQPSISPMAEAIAMEEAQKRDKALRYVTHGKVSRIADRAASLAQDRIDEALPRCVNPHAVVEKSEGERLKSLLYPRDSFAMEDVSTSAGLNLHNGMPYVTVLGKLQKSLVFKSSIGCRAVFRLEFHGSQGSGGGGSTTTAHHGPSSNSGASTRGILMIQMPSYVRPRALTMMQALRSCLDACYPPPNDPNAAAQNALHNDASELQASFGGQNASLMMRQLERRAAAGGGRTMSTSMDRSASQQSHSFMLGGGLGASTYRTPREFSINGATAPSPRHQHLTSAPPGHSCLTACILSMFNWNVALPVPAGRVDYSMVRPQYALTRLRQAPILVRSTTTSNFGGNCESLPSVSASVAGARGTALSSPFEVPIHAGDNILVKCATLGDLYRLLNCPVPVQYEAAVEAPFAAGQLDAYEADLAAEATKARDAAGNVDVVGDESAFLMDEDERFQVDPIRTCPYFKPPAAPISFPASKSRHIIGGSSSMGGSTGFTDVISPVPSPRIGAGGGVNGDVNSDDNPFSWVSSYIDALCGETLFGEGTRDVNPVDVVIWSTPKDGTLISPPPPASATNPSSSAPSHSTLRQQNSTSTTNAAGGSAASDPKSPPDCTSGRVHVSFALPGCPTRFSSERTGMMSLEPVRFIITMDVKDKIPSSTTTTSSILSTTSSMIMDASTESLREAFDVVGVRIEAFTAMRFPSFCPDITFAAHSVLADGAPTATSTLRAATTPTFALRMIHDEQIHDLGDSLPFPLTAFSGLVSIDLLQMQVRSIRFAGNLLTAPFQLLPSLQHDPTFTTTAHSTQDPVLLQVAPLRANSSSASYNLPKCNSNLPMTSRTVLFMDTQFAPEASMGSSGSGANFPHNRHNSMSSRRRRSSVFTAASLAAMHVSLPVLRFSSGVPSLPLDGLFKGWQKSSQCLESLASVLPGDFSLFNLHHDCTVVPLDTKIRSSNFTNTLVGNNNNTRGSTVFNKDSGVLSGHASPKRLHSMASLTGGTSRHQSPILTRHSTSSPPPLQGGSVGAADGSERAVGIMSGSCTWAGTACTVAISIHPNMSLLTISPHTLASSNTSGMFEVYSGFQLPLQDNPVVVIEITPGGRVTLDTISTFGSLRVNTMENTAFAQMACTLPIHLPSPPNTTTASLSDMSGRNQFGAEEAARTALVPMKATSYHMGVVAKLRDGITGGIASLGRTMSWDAEWSGAPTPLDMERAISVLLAYQIDLYHTTATSHPHVPQSQHQQQQNGGADLDNIHPIPAIIIHDVAVSGYPLNKASITVSGSCGGSPFTTSVSVARVVCNGDVGGASAPTKQYMSNRNASTSTTAIHTLPHIIIDQLKRDLALTFIRAMPVDL